MSTFKVFIKIYDTRGTYEADYRDITRDVISLGQISQQLDNTEFDLGVFRNGGFQIKLRNTDARYSDVGNLNSIFKSKRNGTQVRVFWNIQDQPIICGFFKAGEVQLGDDYLVYDGLLSDVVSQATIMDQTIDFQVQGFESLFNAVTTPFTSNSTGDAISDIIYDCLNQSPITDYLTVDALNINLSQDAILDGVPDFQTSTVQEVLNELLPLANSILYIKDRVVYISARTPSVDLKYSFYGQASNLGIENIINIKKYRDGLNRTFNYVTWQNANYFSRDLSSIDRYTILKKEIGTDSIDGASSATIQSLLDNVRDEFAFPKIEMDLDTPLSYNTLALTLLDRVKIDYPNVYFPADNNPLPRYGQTRYGQGRYPFGQFTLTIPDSYRFKILSKRIDTNKQIITFGLRRI